MGCFWSSEADERDRTAYQQRAINASSYGVQFKPRYGEYVCSCGRRWKSYRSWRYKYQNCKRCRRQVYAHMQRDLLPSDMTRIKPHVPEHAKEYCQMCKELGHYCGKSS